MYTIKKIKDKISGIYDSLWDIAQIANININNWQQFEYMPETYAKILHDDYGIYVQLVTFEAPLIARYTHQNDMVCEDSCMEFFIKPDDSDKRYLNFEFNPFGTMYLAVRTSRYDPVFPNEDKHYFDVTSVVENGRWILQFVIPFEFIDKYFGSHSNTMYGNLYKCCDMSDKVHYLSYYPLDPNKIDFHVSECFGEFILEQ